MARLRHPHGDPDDPFADLDGPEAEEAGRLYHRARGVLSGDAFRDWYRHYEGDTDLETLGRMLDVAEAAAGRENGSHGR